MSEEIDDITANMARIGATDVGTKRMMLLVQFMNQKNSRDFSVDINTGVMEFRRS